MRANYLSKRDAAGLLERVRSLKWGSVIKSDRIREALKIEVEGFTLYRLAGILICEKGGVLFPTIHEEYNRGVLDALPALVVDMGAVPRIAGGADVMRPGIRIFIGEFERGDILVVRDERNLRPIAIASALEDRGVCEAMERGRVAENLHHVNDRIWRLVQEQKRFIERI